MLIRVVCLNRMCGAFDHTMNREYQGALAVSREIGGRLCTVYDRDASVGMRVINALCVHRRAARRNQSATFYPTKVEIFGFVG